MHPVKADSIALAKRILIPPGQADVMKPPKVISLYCLTFIFHNLRMEIFSTPW
jgi:hypothetical protein